ncbi:hypothetical protein BST89_24930, partial [Salmonella enterica subsp. enterica serovar Typhi]
YDPLLNGHSRHEPGRRRCGCKLPSPQTVGSVRHDEYDPLLNGHSRHEPGRRRCGCKLPSPQTVGSVR